MIRSFIGRFITAAALLLLPVFAWPADAKDLSLERPLEYFVHQPPGVDMLIRIVGFETEFESRIYDEESNLLRTSRLPSSRLGKLFQLVEETDAMRQLRISIQPLSKTSRSTINLELEMLYANDRPSAALVQAFRLLSYGLQAGGKSDREAGSIMIYSLHEAGSIFRGLGMEELNLWSTYFAAMQTLDIMGDTVTAAESARQIQKSARRARYEDLELAGLLLEGAALSQRSRRLPSTTVAANLEEAHDVLQRGAAMAAEQDFLYQQAWAVNRRGLVYETQLKNSRALEQFLVALDLALPLGDSDLANQVRSAAADASERLGDNQSAVALLQEMNQQLTDAGELEKLAKSLYEQGRLLVTSFQYAEAVEALERALAIEKNQSGSQNEGPAGLLLAKALYNLGQMDRSLAVLQNAIVNTRSADHRQELFEGLGIAASIHRYRGEHGLVNVRRNQQSELVQSQGDKAQLAFDRAVDNQKQQASILTANTDLFQRSMVLARESGNRDLEYLSQLHLCRILSAAGRRDGICANEQNGRSYRRLISSGVPRYILEARYLWAHYLANTGRSDRAINEMSALNEDARYFRTRLRGVLGAWYWENRAALSQQYMTMLLKDPDYVKSGVIDGRRSFAALDQLRTHSSRSALSVDIEDVHSDSVGNDDYHQLRSLIADRVQGNGGESMADLESRIENMLSTIRTGEVSENPARAVATQLNGLAVDEAVLTYYLDENNVHAWIGGKDGIRLLRIPHGQDASWTLTRATQLFSAGNREEIDSALDNLGQLLVAPLARYLKPRLYYIPAGPLSVLPFDAFRINGKYLAENHEVINIMSTSALLSDKTALHLQPKTDFFLGGNPLITASVVPGFDGNPQEMNAVADLFVGPNLHMVQGNALTRDEFVDERFRQAEVIHLASPAIFDLASPSRSRIYLSDSRTAPGGEYLDSEILRSWRLNAALLVLSAAQMSGGNQHSFLNRTPLLADFLDVGVRAILFSLWQNDDVIVASFIDDFYSSLLDNSSPVDSLYEAKRRQISIGNTEGDGAAILRLWSGFQIILN